MVHYLLERGANLNLTACCSTPVASSTSTVLAVARSATSNKNQESPEGKDNFKLHFLYPGKVTIICEKSHPKVIERSLKSHPKFSLMLSKSHPKVTQKSPKSHPFRIQSR